MPIQNIDGYQGSTLQEIFTLLIHSQADIPQHFVQDFSETFFLIRDFDQRPSQ